MDIKKMTQLAREYEDWGDSLGSRLSGEQIDLRKAALLVMRSHWHRHGPRLLEALKRMCDTAIDCDQEALKFALFMIHQSEEVDGL